MKALEQILLEVTEAFDELRTAANLREGDLLVVGCSSSEICGGQIGHASSPEIGKAVADQLLRLCGERGIFLAAQCCEHLNRALILERTAAEKFG